jgi:class 3 adenylate cyclase
MSSLSGEDAVRAFLEAAGLSQYTEQIVDDEGFDDLATLATLTPSEMASDFPFLKTGHMRKLARKAKEWRAANGEAEPSESGAKPELSETPDAGAEDQNGTAPEPKEGKEKEPVKKEEEPAAEKPQAASAAEEGEKAKAESDAAAIPPPAAAAAPRGGRSGKGALGPAPGATDVTKMVTVTGPEHKPREGEPREIDVLASYLPHNLLEAIASGDLPEIGATRSIPQCALMMADVSGFTKLNETLAREGSGKRGGEKMSLYLNDYFATLLAVISRFGGDCQKIAGDALVCTFEANATPKENAAAATACALQLQYECGSFADADISLTLHCGVAVGPMAMAQLGGFNGRLEWTPAGEPLHQLEHTLGLSLSGDVVVSEQVWALISGGFVGEELSEETRPGGSGGEVLVKAITRPVAIAGLASLELNADDPNLLSTVQKYVPHRVATQVEEGQNLLWASEVRDATVVFINMFGLRLNAEFSMISEAQVTVRACQEQVEKFEGYLRQFLCDDKGTTLIVVFGVPPFTHEDDPSRAVKFALAISDLLNPMGIRHSIGISSGPVFVGSVGSELRREHR